MKKFKGFTPQQQLKLLKGLGYSGSDQQDEMDKFLAATPAAATQMGQYAKIAQQQLDGKPLAKTVPSFASGGANIPWGAVFDRTLEPKKIYNKNTSNTTNNQNTTNNNPAPTNVNLDKPTQDDLVKAETPTITEAEKEAGSIDPNAGQLTGSTPTVTGQQAGPAALADAPEGFDAATMNPTTITDQVTNATNNMQAAQGQVSSDAQAQAAQQDPNTIAGLGTDNIQNVTATQVEAVDPRTVQEGELISGVANLDDVSEKTTVQHQLSELYKQMENGETPPWAAGAMRAANQAMAARGIGASSMAGQAIIQATMEAALPIAMQDAQTAAQFQAQEFDQEFAAKQQNAQTISNIANMNFTAEQQTAIENARLAQTADLANMDANNAKLMADAAAMANMDMQNLNNRQQAAIQNANAFLQMDLTNLNNQQQTALFKQQSIINSMFNDQAAENAAAQFNAASENQVNQFFADLQTRVNTFNAEQTNAMSQFDVNQANAIEQFNATMENQRQQFNAQNDLVIAQANAKWRQDITTQEFAAETQANMQYAQAWNGMTSQQLDHVWQRERDIMAFAFQSAENAADRDAQLLLANKQNKWANDRDESAAWGALAAEVIGGFF